MARRRRAGPRPPPRSRSDRTRSRSAVRVGPATVRQQPAPISRPAGPSTAGGARGCTRSRRSAVPRARQRVQLVAVQHGRRARAPSTAAASAPARPRRAGPGPQHRHQRHHARPAGRRSCTGSGLARPPHEPAADAVRAPRPGRPTFSTWTRYGETSPSGTRSTVTSTPLAVAARTTSSTTARAVVAVRRGQPDVEVLAGDVPGPAGDLEDAASARSRSRRRTATTSPTRQVSRPSTAAPAMGLRSCGSPALSQNPGSSVVRQRDAADPLGALPQVQVRDQQPGRPAVLGLEVLAVVPEGDPGLAVEQVVQRQVRGVAAVRVHERVLGGRLDVGQQRVQRHALPVRCRAWTSGSRSAGRS